MDAPASVPHLSNHAHTASTGSDPPGHRLSPRLHITHPRRLNVYAPRRPVPRAECVRVRRAECPHSGELVRRERGGRVAALWTSVR
jgi:hypothetical protein